MMEKNNSENKKSHQSPSNFVAWLSFLLAVLLILRVESSRLLDHADEYQALPFIVAFAFIFVGQSDNFIHRFVLNQRIGVIIAAIIGAGCLIYFDFPSREDVILQNRIVLDWILQIATTLVLGSLIAALILITMGTYKFKRKPRKKIQKKPTPKAASAN